MSKLKDLGIRRYKFTAYHNVTYSFTFSALPGVQNLDPIMLTVEDLIASVARKMDEKDHQQLANYKTTLHSYMAFVGKTDSSPVGPELGRHFDRTCREYCAALNLSERTIRDRRSHLNMWREAAAREYPV
jgi:hypothetical protein